MDMSRPRQYLDRHRALTSAGGLATGAFLPLAGPSPTAATAPARTPVYTVGADYTNPVI
jgi:hypothetical protein